MKRVTGIMVILRNIVKNDQYISCEYLHEDEKDVFEMIFDYHSGKLIKATDPSNSGHTYHAMKKLQRLSALDTVPQTAREMWK